jgi:hypothetical protein
VMAAIAFNIDINCAFAIANWRSCRRSCCSHRVMAVLMILLLTWKRWRWRWRWRRRRRWCSTARTCVNDPLCTFKLIGNWDGIDIIMTPVIEWTHPPVLVAVVSKTMMR